MIDVRRLRVLVEVARRGSLAAAADALGYSPSAVSHQLMRLEQELGVELVERSVNSLMLTEAGRVLAARGPDVLAEVQAAEAEVRAAGQAGADGAHIAAFASAGPVLVAPVMRSLRADAGAPASVTIGDPEDTLPLLRSGMVDVALTYEYEHLPARGHGRLRRDVLMVEPMRLAVAAGHPLAAAPAPVALADLAAEEWIVEGRADCRHFTVHACAAAGVEARMAARSTDYGTTQALVAAGVGVALVPVTALATPHAGVVVIDLVRPPSRQIYAATRPHGSRRRTRPLLRLLHSAAQDFSARVAVPLAGDPRAAAEA